MKCLLRHRIALSLPARVLALVLVVAAAAAPAGAQSTTSATLYRLEAGSPSTRGSSGPCLAPTFPPKEIRGPNPLPLDQLDPPFPSYRAKKVTGVAPQAGVD